MSALSVLAGLAKVGGKVYEGYGIDRERRLASALADQKQKQAEENDRVLNAYRQAQTTALGQPEPTEYTPTRFNVDGNAVQGFSTKAGQYFDANRQPVSGEITPFQEAPQSRYSPIVTTGPAGEQNLSVLDTTRGTVTNTGQAAKAGAPARPTEAQMRANLVTPRAEQAANDLMSFYESGAPLKTLLQRVPVVGNFAMNEEEQRMNQAAEVLASAVLRLESGAAITEGEIRSYAKQLIPAPGDTPEVLAQKKATVQRALGAMRSQSTIRTDTATRPPLADRVQQLKAQGLTRDQARAKLAQEGYEVQ